MNKPTPIVLTINDWNTSGIRYMQPKVNDRGAKTINLISTQTNRALSVQTPLMMTWGISDFVDEKTGESDGKYTMSLNFPNDQYRKPATDEFLKKLIDFENQVLDDAVKNSEIWFGEEMSRDVLKHTFFPVLKYVKDKQTKKIDKTKPPAIRAKIPNYNGRWSIEIYDTSSNMLFPDSKNENITPIDLVPKQSNVACVLQCGGIWFGGKGWGVTWKVIQLVVKPKEVISVFGKCHIKLTEDELDDIEKLPESVEVPEEEKLIEAVVTKKQETLVEDSDEEEQAKPSTVKKIVKKATPTETVVEATTSAAVEMTSTNTAQQVPPMPMVKKVVKKKA